MGILHPGTPPAITTLKDAVDAAVGVAKTVGLVYAFRFRFMGVEDEIDQLVRHSVEVFPRYRQAVRSGALT